jgi:hypothetical protein
MKIGRPVSSAQMISSSRMASVRRFANIAARVSLKAVAETGAGTNP